MTNEQKEGVIIFAFAGVLLIIIAFITDWRGSISTSSFGFAGFTVDDCNDIDKRAYKIPDGQGGFVTKCRHTRQAGYLYINFSTALLFLFPIIVYGLLRSFGIIRRIFDFEKTLSKLILAPPSDQTSRSE